LHALVASLQYLVACVSEPEAVYVRWRYWKICTKRHFCCESSGNSTQYYLQWIVFQQKSVKLWNRHLTAF